MEPVCECGQPAETCEQAWGECLALEFSDPEYGAVHHLTVSAYMLQHPGRLSAGGWWAERRLLAEFLDDPGRPVAAVALSCGYAADSSLRLALRRFTGQNPSELREHGAFGVASRNFVEELARARTPKRRYRAQSRVAADSNGAPSPQG